jgi:hypothetical protein
MAARSGKSYYRLKSENQFPDLVGLIFRAAAGQVPGMARSQRVKTLDFAFRLLKRVYDKRMGKLCRELVREAECQHHL